MARRPLDRPDSGDFNDGAPKTTLTPPRSPRRQGDDMPEFALPAASGMHRSDTVAAIVVVAEGLESAVVVVPEHKPESSASLSRALHISAHTLITIIAVVVGGQFALLSADAVKTLPEKLYYGLCSDIPNTLGTMTAILSAIKLIKDLREAYKNEALDRSSKIILFISVVMTLSAIITSLPLANDSVEALLRRYIDDHQTRAAVRWMLSLAWAVGYTGSTRLSGAYALLNKLYDKSGLMGRLEPEKQFLRRFTQDLKKASLTPDNINTITNDFIRNFYANATVTAQLAQTTETSYASRAKTAMTVALVTGTIQLLPFGMELGSRGTRLLPGGSSIPEWAVHMMAALAGLTFTVFYANSASLIVDRTEKVATQLWKNSALVALTTLGALIALSYGSSKGMAAEGDEFSHSDSPYNVSWFVFPAIYSGLVALYAGGANGNFILGFMETILAMMKKYTASAPKAVAEELFSAYELEHNRKGALPVPDADKEQALKQLGHGKHNIADLSAAMDTRCAAVKAARPAAQAATESWVTRTIYRLFPSAVENPGLRQNLLDSSGRPTPRHSALNDASSTASMPIRAFGAA